MTEFSKWTKRKTIGAALLALSFLFLAFFVVIVISGDAYDRWRDAHHLRVVYQAWLRDGSPEPPSVERYVLPGGSSTTYVYTASHVIKGQTYRGLFATRSNERWGTFVITRSGEVILVGDSGKARVLRISETKAAAW